MSRRQSCPHPPDLRLFQPLHHLFRNAPWASRVGKTEALTFVSRNLPVTNYVYPELPIKTAFQMNQIFQIDEGKNYNIKHNLWMYVWWSGNPYSTDSKDQIIVDNEKNPQVGWDLANSRQRHFSSHHQKWGHQAWQPLEEMWSRQSTSVKYWTTVAGRACRWKSGATTLMKSDLGSTQPRADCL